MTDCDLREQANEADEQPRGGFPGAMKVLPACLLAAYRRVGLNQEGSCVARVLTMVIQRSRKIEGEGIVGDHRQGCPSDECILRGTPAA